MSDQAGGRVTGGLDEPDLQPEPGTLALAGPDDDWSRQDWEKAAAAVLRKAGRMSADDPDDAVWEALTHTTYDGVRITPLGHDGPPSPVRPERAGPWDIRALAFPGPEARVNRELLDDLEGGATSVWVDVAPDTDIGTLLDGVRLDLAAVVLRPTGDPRRTSAAFLEAVAGQALHPATNLGSDPALADEESVDAARGAGVLGFVVDGDAVHRRGGSDAQELGWALATAATYLRRLEALGVPPTEAASLVEFRLAVSDVQLVSIAKLRAARLLWSRMLEVAGGDEVPMRLHAVTSAPMTSRYDPWVNIVRGTVAAFAAGVGGADAVTVLPFDAPLGRPDAFGRRIARNVSSLLIAESHVAAVADPAGGAFVVEDLTRQLAGAAWAELGMIETDGDEAFAERVRDVRARRRDDVAHRRLPITGLSEFPDLAETLPEREPDPSALGHERYGRDFEELRTHPPSDHVFLATLGPVAEHSPRAGFAANLLAAGGVAVDRAGATDGVDDVLTAYAGQRVVCLAGTDPAYAAWGSEVATRLRAAGAAYVVVAGEPPGWSEWADDSCTRDIDAVAFLKRIRGALS